MKKQKWCLDADITYSEIEKAILQMKLGKNPELDGFTVDFYRTFREE